VTLRAEDISWSVGGHLIIDGIACEVGPGQLVGLLGPNGSGKSTLLRCIAQLQAPDRGRARLGDTDLGTLRRRQLARRLAFVEQDAPTDLDYTVLEVVLLGRTPYRRALELDSDADCALAVEALARTGLAGFERRRWRTLSGGERQRARIARALTQEPEALLLDEPTNHLDIAHQLDVLELIRSLGLCTLAALHDLNLAAMYCDRLVVLDAGRVAAAGAPAEVLTAQLIREVYGVDAEIAAHPVRGTLTVTLLGTTAPQSARRVRVT
jgi:iron complex transport system ATP-binding protein